MRSEPCEYSRMKIKLGVYLTAFLVALLIAGCGNGSKTSSGDNGGSAEQTAATGGSSTEVKAGKPPKVTGSLSEKPAIAAPDGYPPERLVVKDIKRGSGKKAKSGDKLKMMYVGVNWSTGAEFDTSWKPGAKPFEFDLGAGMVIKGWDKGIAGMRVGGRRELIIPPDLGYGDAGSPPAIPPSETLVFVVDLKRVK
jgi:peptidylprolyl isomerase